MNIRQAIKQLSIEAKADLLTGSGFWTTPACADIGLDSVSVSDGPHGMRVQDTSPSHLGLGASLPATCFPTAASMACSWDEDLCEGLGQRLGREAAFQGASMILGPGLNVKRSPLCGRNFEYFSEDGYLSGRLAAAYARGIQSSGVTSCVKHYAVNSRELGRMVCDCVLDERTLRETYLTGFEIALKEGGAGAVMTAYNKVNGVYCNDNNYLIRGILRGEWHFDGLVISDWGGGRDSVAAVKAGSDLEMPRCKFSAPDVVSAVKRGELDENLVDDCVERLYKFVDKSKSIERKPFDEGEHSDYARKCAEGSLVLLKNEGGALPLKPTERVALIGDFAQNPRYQGAGSSLVNPTSLADMLGEIKKSRLNFAGYARGFKRYGKYSRRLASQALRLGKSADAVVLCLGLDEDNETEGADRSELFLPSAQTELLCELSSLGKKIIVVLSCGSVVDTGWDIMADGVIYAGLGGQNGACAVVRALAGEINPSGRLAESYPFALSDVPCSNNYSSDAYRMNYNEGIYVGYKYYSAAGVAVRYPFGYGLSYTTFSYGGFCADVKGVSVTVRNAGDRDGATVAQVYVKCPRPDLASPPSELKAFKKIFLSAGEEKRVFIPFDDYSFRTWNGENSRWEVGGEYEISLGENSRDVLFTQKIEINKDNYRLPEGYAFREELNAGALNNREPLKELNAGALNNREPLKELNAGALNNREPLKESSAGALTIEEYFASLAERNGGGAEEKPPEKSGKRGKKRVVADYRTIVSDLIYCKGVVGKVMGLVARHFNSSRDKVVANAMNYLPLRSLMQFMKLDSVQAEGFIEACNGRFLRGMRKLIFKR